MLMVADYVFEKWAKERYWMLCVSHTYTRIATCISIYMHMYIYTHTHMYINTHIHVHKHVYKHIYIYVYMHIHTQQIYVYNMHAYMLCMTHMFYMCVINIYMFYRYLKT